MWVRFLLTLFCNGDYGVVVAQKTVNLLEPGSIPANHPKILPRWCNGSHDSFRHYFLKGSAGSSPVLGTKYKIGRL